MTNLDEAYRMIDTFATCGANSFVVTKTELEWPGHKKVKWGKTYSLDALREKLPGIVRTAAIKHPVSLPDGQGVMAGENVIIRPTGPGVAFVQLDDLKTSSSWSASAPQHSSFTPRAPEIIRPGLRSPAFRRIRNSSRSLPGACAGPWAVTINPPRTRRALPAPKTSRSNMARTFLPCKFWRPIPGGS